MILSVFQRKKINSIIDKYSKNAEWVICDENTQYKNSEYESVIYGIGTGETKKHLTDETVFNSVELTYYYNKQCQYFVQAYRVIYDNSLTIIVYQNVGTGLNGSKTVERIELLRNRVKPKDKCLTK